MASMDSGIGRKPGVVPEKEHSSPDLLGAPRRLAAVTAVCVIMAAGSELFGRALYIGWHVGYGVTGTLTLLALLIWGAGSVYVVLALGSPRAVKRLMYASAFLLVFSQTASLAHYFEVPFIGTYLLGRAGVLALCEDGSFILGVAVLFTGFYKAIFETGRATIRTAAKQRELEELNRELEQRIKRRTLELTQANEALSRRNTQRDAILNTAMDAFCIVDGDGRFLEVNEAFAQMSGFSMEELRAMTVRDIEARESAEEVMRHVGEIIEQGYDRFETLHRRKDGSLLWAEVSTNYLRDSGQMFCFIRDITERKRHEEALIASEVKYRDLVENANSIILRMNARAEITFFNEFAQRFFGYQEYEILGRKVVGTILSEFDSNGQDMALMLQDMFVTPAQYLNHENENMLRDGERAWIAWANRPIYDEHGGLKEMLCVGNDITARKIAERLLVEQRVKMVNTARLSSLGIMASGIAHEINNPLAIVSAGAEQLESLLADPVENLDRMQNVIHLIRRNSTRIQRIVRGLRGVSRDASNDPFTAASIGGIIADMEELSRERFKNHGVELRIEDHLDEIEIECRPSQLCQVIINLLNNALDAVNALEEKWVRVQVCEKEDDIRIDVTDSGAGIAADVVDKLFVPFFTTKPDLKSTGLGLSLSRAMIEAHHGVIFLDTTCENTRFTVILPKKQPSESASA